jgi:osmoprotectant transport system permease protein
MQHLPGLHFHYSKPITGWFSWSYVSQNAHAILSAAGQHVELVLMAVGLGILLTVPLVLVARRRQWARGGVLAVCSAAYAVPSLAFVVALFPIFGLSKLTVVIPLAAYSLIILVRNTLAGLDGVPAETMDAATGIGFGPARAFFRVRLPLALPAIIAGLRIATVSTIELVVIGGYVGEGGFGTKIFEGFDNNEFKAEITTYIILTVLLAITADLLLLAIQRLVTPWQRRGVA